MVITQQVDGPFLPIFSVSTISAPLSSGAVACRFYPGAPKKPGKSEEYPQTPRIKQSAS